MNTQRPFSVGWAPLPSDLVVFVLHRDSIQINRRPRRQWCLQRSRNVYYIYIILASLIKVDIHKRREYCNKIEKKRTRKNTVRTLGIYVCPIVKTRAVFSGFGSS